MARIRICGGQWRSRLINVVDVPGLRPTPDRVRETLFNWLGQDLTGMSCLDLFAGSGVLGFEAASRGARRVTLVERDAKAFVALRLAATALGGRQLELRRADALEFLTSVSEVARTADHDAATGQASQVQGSRYDLIFLDPPYHQGWLARVEPYLPAVATERARLYVEAEQALQSLGDWHCVRRGKVGHVHYHLLERS